MLVGASACGVVAALLLLVLLRIPGARPFTVSRVATDRLPLWLAGLLADQTVLSAFSIPERKRIILWVLDETARNSREIEFSTRSRKRINLDQRARELPHKQRLRFGHYAIDLSYRLDDMDRVTENAVVARGDTEILRKEHPYYLEVSFAPREHKAERFTPWLKAAEAEWDYDRSPDELKVASWVRKLYRQRRRQVESGLDPDLVFDDLRTAVAQRDPAAVALIPSVIETLAKMEGEDPAGLWRRYSARAVIGSDPN